MCCRRYRRCSRRRQYACPTSGSAAPRDRYSQHSRFSSSRGVQRSGVDTGGVPARDRGVSMSSLNLRLSESLHNKIRKLAQQEDMSINQFIATDVAEKAAALLTVDYLEERAGRSDPRLFARGKIGVVDVGATATRSWASRAPCPPALPSCGSRSCPPTWHGRFATCSTTDDGSSCRRRVLWRGPTWSPMRSQSSNAADVTTRR